jgi:hypothetical protein
VPVYQYYAPDPWRYLYSRNSQIGSGWIYEGVAFHAYAQHQPGTREVLQFYAADPWRYFYTIRNEIRSGWTFETTAFHVFDASPI